MYILLYDLAKYEFHGMFREEAENASELLVEPSSMGEAGMPGGFRLGPDQLAVQGANIAQRVQSFADAYVFSDVICSPKSYLPYFKAKVGYSQRGNSQCPTAPSS